MSKPSYQNFDLRISSSEEGYEVDVDCPMGQYKGQFSLPFSASALQSFLQGSSRGAAKRKGDAPSETLNPQQFGELLYDAVFGGEVGLGLIRSLDETERDGTGLRLRLRLDEDVLDLAELPWELLFARPFNRFFVLSNQTALVRYLALPQKVEPLQINLIDSDSDTKYGYIWTL